MKKRYLVLAILVLAAVLAAVWYMSSTYSSEVNVDDYLKKEGTIKVSEIKDGLFLDGQGSDTAVIFYPGAKVEYTSYLPLLYQLAEQGTDSFLIEMPLDMAFLGIEKADKIMADYEYENWYMAGHSLGGAMAAVYASEHLKNLDGLILLAAYPTENLNSKDFSVLSLYGSEDHILNYGKLENSHVYMPEAFTEICIEGGNHAGFGNYGEQNGDGEALISREEQQERTAEEILKFMGENL